MYLTIKKLKIALIVTFFMISFSLRASENRMEIIEEEVLSLSQKIELKVAEGLSYIGDEFDKVNATSCPDLKRFKRILDFLGSIIQYDSENNIGHLLAQFKVKCPATFQEAIHGSVHENEFKKRIKYSENEDNGNMNNSNEGKETGLKK